MTIETAQYITQLDQTQPTSKSDVGEDDDHLRLIRTVLKASFPQFDDVITFTREQVNGISAKVTDLARQKTTLETAKTGGINVATAQTASVLAFDWHDFNLEQDLPANEIYALWFDAGGTNTLTPEWVKCDGTNGTENLTNMAIELVGSAVQEALPISHYSGLYVIKYVGS